MNCLRCELARAKVKALALYSVGWHFERIADKLSKDYGEAYYVRVQHGKASDVWTIERFNKLPPHNHFEIFRKELTK